MLARMERSLAVWLALATAGASGPILLSLEPIADEALHGCEAADLERALRSSFGKARQFRLSPDAAVRLEIEDCTLATVRKRTLTSTGRPVHMPTEGGTARGNEQEVAVETESIRSAVLRGRVVAGSRSANVASGSSDQTLREAADSLRRAIDKLLKGEGDWLLAPPAP
jgi:hypothetical protein